MNTIDKQKQKIELIVKIVGLLVVGFIVQPFIFMAMQGAIALFVGVIITALTVAFLPYLALKISNWKLKALKYEASQNPIETLENQYKERESGLIKFRENIQNFHAEVNTFYTVFAEHKERYPEKSQAFEEQYSKMKQLLDTRSKKYKLAQKQLREFSDVIEQKRSEWKIAQAAAKMSKAAGLGEDFINKLLSDTAISSIQTNLNNAFAELEVSLLDESEYKKVEVVQNTIDKNSKTTLLLEPPTLDLDFEVIQKEKVTK